MLLVTGKDHKVASTRYLNLILSFLQLDYLFQLRDHVMSEVAQRSLPKPNDIQLHT
jgi:hypothetical protein